MPRPRSYRSALDVLFGGRSAALSRSTPRCASVLTSVSLVWWSRRALFLHATLAVLLPGFGTLAWWQTSRALDGNTLSWVYAFEWPFFAAYAVFMWWKILHETSDADSSDAEGVVSREPSRSTAAAPEPEIDAELDAYNRYLSSLHASDAARRGRTHRLTKG